MRGRDKRESLRGGPGCYHVTHQEFEQEWTFKQGLLRRPTMADAVQWLACAAVVIAVVLGFFWLMGERTTVTVDCSAANWELLPGHLEWAAGMRMVPQDARCQITASGPAYVFAGMSRGRS